jgi:hypothetical protein
MFRDVGGKFFLLPYFHLVVIRNLNLIALKMAIKADGIQWLHHKLDCCQIFGNNHNFVNLPKPWHVVIIISTMDNGIASVFSTSNNNPFCPEKEMKRK